MVSDFAFSRQEQLDTFKEVHRILSNCMFEEEPIDLPDSIIEELVIFTLGGIDTSDWQSAVDTWQRTSNPVSWSAPYSYLRSAAIGSATKRVREWNAQRLMEVPDGPR